MHDLALGTHQIAPPINTEPIVSTIGSNAEHVIDNFIFETLL